MLNLLKYSQGDESWGPDHFSILFEINSDYNIYSKRTNRICKNRTDWSKFTGILLNREEEFNSIEYIESTGEEKYTKFTELLRETTGGKIRGK